MPKALLPTSRVCEQRDALRHVNAYSTCLRRVIAVSARPARCWMEAQGAKSRHLAPNRWRHCSGTSCAPPGDSPALAGDDDRTWRIPDDVVGYGSEKRPLDASPTPRPDDDHRGALVRRELAQGRAWFSLDDPRLNGILQRGLPKESRNRCLNGLLTSGVSRPVVTIQLCRGQAGGSIPVASSANEGSRTSATDTTSTLSHGLRTASPATPASMASSEPSVPTTRVVTQLRISVRRFAPHSGVVGHPFQRLSAPTQQCRRCHAPGVCSERESRYEHPLVDPQLPHT